MQCERLNTFHRLCMRTVISLLSIIVMMSIAHAKRQIRADHTDLELIYVGPGQGTYSLFGHVAVRVKHVTYDHIYDLGITSHIGLEGLLDVALGRALFHGEVRSFSRMLKSWQRRDRDVISYQLILPQRLKKSLVIELESLVRGKVIPYLYDPLRENCATQLRQVLDTVMGGTLSLSIQHKTKRQTFRDDTRDGYAKQLGILTAIELMVGFSLDHNRSDWAMSYRPLTLVEELKKIRIGGQRMLGTPKNYYLRMGPATTGGEGQSILLFIFMMISIPLLVFLILTYWRARKRLVLGLTLNLGVWSIYYIVSLLLFVSSVIALALTMKSAWTEVRNGWLLILGSPLDCILLTLTPRSSTDHMLRIRSYLQSRVVISCFCVLLVFIGVGELPTLALSLWVILAWGTCFLVLSILKSLSVVDDSTEEEQDDPDDRSWLELN
jgi:hypothetical protein